MGPAEARSCYFRVCCAVGLTLCAVGGCYPAADENAGSHSVVGRLQIADALPSEHCPENFTLVQGTNQDNNLVAHAASDPLCVIAGDGNDNVVSNGKPKRVIDAGPGNDNIVGQAAGLVVHAGLGDDNVTLAGNGAGQVYAGSGNDKVVGSAGADHIEGGTGNDDLVGGNGADKLFGQDGDDRLVSGPGMDAIAPGAGRDVVVAGPGDDVVVIMAACQVASGETLDGGSGTDLLLTPLDRDALAAAGVNVLSFERVQVFPLDGFACDPNTCVCSETFPVVTPTELCDYSPLADDDLNVGAIQQACEQFVDALPSLVLALPESPTEQDIDAIAKHDPDWIPAMQEIVHSVSHQQGPTIVPKDAPGSPQAGVSTSMDVCDRPERDLHVGVARAGVNNCSNGEEQQLRELLDIASYVTWRTSQHIDAVLDAPSPQQAQALWDQGDWNYPLASWFGPFSVERAETVKQTLDIWLQTLHGDDDGPFGPDDNVQCYHPLKWWQWVAFGLFSPATIVAKTVANPCWHNRVSNSETHAHAAFSLPVVGRPQATAAFYPFRSIEVCEVFFDDHDLNDPAERIALATVLLHEFLHWRSNDAGDLRDKHGSADNGICPNQGCSLQEHALELAAEAPDVALVSIINYQEWANVVAAAYTLGFCDTTHNPLCVPSDCCGDGIRQADLGEACDESDFGGATCLSQAGLSDGALLCSGDCATIDSDNCSGGCGNDVVDPALGEVCDGADLGGETCADHGFELGSVTCNGCVGYDTSGCSGGTGDNPPSGYTGCLEPGESCDQPEDCYSFESSGYCAGGPCARTDPAARADGQLDPTSNFHPRGNFRDSLGNLYLCYADDEAELTCIDEDGWGVCRRCGHDDGETMLGCACATAEQCTAGGEALDCWGGQFPQGGYCWPASGPPSFQCRQGACGQVYGTGSASYCEHYPDAAADARCMSQSCQEIQAQVCAGSDFICAESYDEDDNIEQNCANECVGNDDCSTQNLWPSDFVCFQGECALGG